MIFLALKIIYPSSKHLDFFCQYCKIDMKDDRCIYVILAKIGSAYSVFVSTFYATREALGILIRTTLESFCDSLIREKDKLCNLE
jgi:hypothetical protein